MQGISNRIVSFAKLYNQLAFLVSVVSSLVLNRKGYCRGLRFIRRGYRKAFCLYNPYSSCTLRHLIHTSKSSQLWCITFEYYIDYVHTVYIQSPSAIILFLWLVLFNSLWLSVCLYYKYLSIQFKSRGQNWFFNKYYCYYYKKVK
jgi:hypothetical protein